MTTFHFVSGSFRSLSLFLLAFDPVHKSIHHVQTLSTLGPHQYLATNQHKDRIFTTTWTEPPSLQSWALTRNDSQPWRLSHLHTVPISMSAHALKLVCSHRFQLPSRPISTFHHLLLTSILSEDQQEKSTSLMSIQTALERKPSKFCSFPKKTSQMPTKLVWLS